MDIEEGHAAQFDQALTEYGGAIGAALAGLEIEDVPAELHVTWEAMLKGVEYLRHLESDVDRWMRPYRDGWQREAATARAQATVPGADPDRACEHPDFNANVEVNRLTESDDDPTVIAYDTTIAVWCANCDEKFRWIGVQAGSSPARPMCSVDETELRAPIRPASADPDFGLGIPGFAVTWTGGDDV